MLESLLQDRGQSPAKCVQGAQDADVTDTETEPQCAELNAAIGVPDPLTRAFQLDREAGDRKVIEQLYRQSLQATPGSATGWAHYVGFLFTLGRSKEGKAAFEAAGAALTAGGRCLSTRDYLELHLPLARLLLHKAHIKTAGQVIDQVHCSDPLVQPGLTALRELWGALQEVRRSGHGVFPLTVPFSQWWQGPHLLPAESPDGLRLHSWNPGVIDEVDPQRQELYIVVAEQRRNEDPRYGSCTVTFSDFNSWHPEVPADRLQPRRFLELGFYGPESAIVTLVRLHAPNGPWDDPNLPPLELDPLRYLRAAGWVRE